MNDLNFLQLHTKALYKFDDDEHIIANNQFDGGHIPRFHLARSKYGNFSLFQQGLPTPLKKSLQSFVKKEPPLLDPQATPLYQEKYLDILSLHRPITSIWHGPAYRIKPIFIPTDPEVIEINQSNKSLLNPLMQDWLSDVPHRVPFLAAIVGGQAVSICASVRITSEAHEAGVETHPQFRGRGWAIRTVSAWAKAVIDRKTIPLYSTSWENQASQAVAQKLNMVFIGTDFHIF